MSARAQAPTATDALLRRAGSSFFEMLTDLSEGAIVFTWPEIVTCLPSVSYG